MAIFLRPEAIPIVPDMRRGVIVGSIIYTPLCTPSPFASLILVGVTVVVDLVIVKATAQVTNGIHACPSLQGRRGKAYFDMQGRPRGDRSGQIDDLTCIRLAQILKGRCTSNPSGCFGDS